MTTPSRPQRILTDQEWEILRATDGLTLHRVLLLGIADPVPAPSPMPEDEGAWVREHAWPAWMRVVERGYPWGFWRWTHCQRGSCWNCMNERCDLCVHRQRGGPDVAPGHEAVHGLRGESVARFLPRPDGAVCSWTCRCPCPKTGDLPAPRPRPAAAPVVTEPTAAPRQRERGDNLIPLFDLEEVVDTDVQLNNRRFL